MTENINYKKLYESSQSSLSDLASKHAESLAKLGKLRQGLILSIKKNNPDFFNKIENDLSKKFNQLSEDIILAYIDYLLKNTNDKNEIYNISNIKNNLQKLGINFKGNDLSTLSVFLDELALAGFKISNNDTIGDLFEMDDTKELEINIENNIDNFKNIEESEGVESYSPLIEYVEPIRPEIIRKNTGRKKKNVQENKLIFEKPLFKDEGTFRNNDISNLSSELVEKLVITSFVNRPIFSRDLSSVAGSREIVDLWEELCRTSPSKYPVRFILPKLKHKLRGSLVIPSISNRFVDSDHSKNWWWIAVDLYRGAKLYETAVLLNSLSIQITEHNFLDDYATYSYQPENGNKRYKVIQLFDTSLLENNKLKDLISLSLTDYNKIILLFSTTENNPIEKAITYLRMYRNGYGLDDSVQLLVSYSWEFADNLGATAYKI